jgi:hypothetical protein
MKQEPITIDMNDVGRLWTTRVITNDEVKQINEKMENIKPFVKATRIPGVSGGIGSFAGAFELRRFS